MNIEIKAEYDDNFYGIVLTFGSSRLEISRDDYHLFGVETKGDTEEALTEADKSMITKIGEMLSKGTTFLKDEKGE